MRFALGDLERVLLPSTEPLVRFQRINLNPTDAFVLSRVDGTLSARQVFEITPLPREDVEASLVGLLTTGMIEAAAPEPSGAELESQARRQEILDFHAGLAGRNHLDTLGVSAQATSAEIKAAYFRLARRFHPDVHHDPALADLRERLEQIFARVTQAYGALKDADTRRLQPLAAGRGGTAPSAAVAPGAPGPSGEDVLRSADERFEQGRYWECVALAETVLRYEDRTLQVRARVLLARAYLTHPGTEKQSEQVLLAALRDAPDNVDALVLLGRTYERAGVKARAAGMYRRALELRPRHREALLALEALGPAPPAAAAEASGGGLLGRLRRKR
jgi:tetratricopeptide (TPR) repeat protein